MIITPRPNPYPAACFVMALICAGLILLDVRV